MSGGWGPDDWTPPINETEAVGLVLKAVLDQTIQPDDEVAVVATRTPLRALVEMVAGPEVRTCGHFVTDPNAGLQPGFLLGSRPGWLLCVVCFSDGLRRNVEAGPSPYCDVCADRTDTEPVHLLVDRLLLAADLCASCWSAVSEAAARFLP